MTTALTLILSTNIGGIITGSGSLAKLILIILTVLSIISWAVAFDKIRMFKRCERDTTDFLRRLPDDFSIFDAKHYSSFCRNSNLPRLLLAAATSVEQDLEVLPGVRSDDARMIANRAKSAMERVALKRLEEMERHLGVLATTASVSPFLGLFGTVWGVMNSFISMGEMGSASLTVVGPGVAEALITTVFGLGAAIPALVAYNWLVNFTRRETIRMDSFVSRISDGIEREILRELSSAKVSV